MKRGMIKTVNVTDRRDLHFSTMKDLLDDVERLGEAPSRRATGNWTAAQVVQHVAKLINLSIDGFPIPKAPLPLRVIGRLIRNRALIKPWRPGYKFPKSFTFLDPDPEISWDQAARYLSDTFDRLESQRMTAPSPLLGPLSHEKWEQFHCRHAEMHLGFVHGEGVTSSTPAHSPGI